MLSTNPRERIFRILVDLKPALDGYAGIPQETRLLFCKFLDMQDCMVEGLIQHGGRRLTAGLRRQASQLRPSRVVDRLSRVIVSVYDDRRDSVLDTLAEQVGWALAVAAARLRALTGRSMRPGMFEPQLFDDFIWRTLFSKTLHPDLKASVTSARYRILQQPRHLLHQAGGTGARLLPLPRFAQIDTRGYDFLIAQTPLPAKVSPGTQLVVRYHDSVPLLMPHTIHRKAFHRGAHFHALNENVRRGAWFSCVSAATRNDLLQIYPEVEDRSVVIHNMISEEYFPEDSPRSLVRQIIRNRLATVKEFSTDISSLAASDDNRQSSRLDYLLMVSTLEPRKNHLLLVGAWERLKYTGLADLKLVVVGSLGWDHGPILRAFRPWAERGDLFYLSDVPSTELRLLYRHSQATVCPSLAEGFDYSGVEAMQSGSVVVASDIPVHREIFASAAEYFSAYSPEHAAAVLRRVLEGDVSMLRESLRTQGQQVAQRFQPSVILPQWQSFFDGFRVRAGRSTTRVGAELQPSGPE